MDNHLDLKSFSEQLLRNGVSPRRTRRFRRELLDHFEDLTIAEIQIGETKETAIKNACARLGSTDEIAKTVLSHPELRSLIARWPWFFYTMLPTVTLIVLPGLATFVAASTMELAHGVPPPSERLANTNQALFIFTCVTPLLIATAIARSAISRRFNTLWPTFGIIVISVLGGSLESFIGFAEPDGYWLAATSYFAPPYPGNLTSTISRGLVGLFIVLIPYLYLAKTTQGNT